ncbi:M48 family metallopeptidase [Paracidobacterium acidisoli]|uniref:Peptidase M48 n=1 Tax=Paracidobacterium acidisoli TaxID=2303751 RepID=A0A372ITB4_9BACT|nr:M48 family metallopeptidase [Paracidobacterium acidisoli]MBT9329593.1 M48 family metalloprotease [Paracidobacterium acidisoli]
MAIEKLSSRVSLHLLIAATLALAPAVASAAPAAAPDQSGGSQSSPSSSSGQSGTSTPASSPASAGGTAQTTSAPSDASAKDSKAPAQDSANKDQDKDKKDKKKDQQSAEVPQSAFPQAQPDQNGMMPGVKPGSIDDVSSIGTRDIGARGMGNWYSTDSEIKMGKQYAMEVERSTKFITDPMITEYVNRIGQNIVKNSDCKVPFTIKVIDSDEINAFALPGGFFFVNSGLILAADEEAELAGVMAHETAHVCAHHAAREMTRANYAQLGTIPLIFIGGWTGYGIYEAANIGIPLTFLQFSREFEAQADYLGVQYMYKAGYDPDAMISFFEKIENLEKQKPGAVARAFADHPQTPDRIGHSQEEIARILPPRDEYLVTTSEFSDVKARLARIENKRKLKDLKNGSKPTLRRASTSSTDSSGGDDRPTLHRRDDTNSN